jgi:hypothetical protein
MHLEDSTLCLEGCGVAETIDYLIVGCDINFLNCLDIFVPLPMLWPIMYHHFAIFIPLVKKRGLGSNCYG